MPEKFNFGKSVEHTIEGGAIILAGPAVVESALQAYGPELPEIAGTSLEPIAEAAGVAIDAAQGITPAIMTALIMFYAGKYMVDKAINPDNKKKRA